MYLFRTYLCEACGHRFDMMQEREEGPPSFCPSCGAGFARSAPPVPGTHRIGGRRIVKSIDHTYRLAEEAGAARARLAERHGVPAEAARRLKITDMKDGLREGDVAASRQPVVNPTTEFMRAAASKGIQYGFLGGGAIGGSAGVAPPRIGPEMVEGKDRWKGPGHKAMAAIQPDHQKNLAAVVAGGLRAPRGS